MTLPLDSRQSRWLQWFDVACTSVRRRVHLAFLVGRRCGGRRKTERDEPLRDGHVFRGRGRTPDVGTALFLRISTGAGATTTPRLRASRACTCRIPQLLREVA
jgi:hypothetical protein